MMARILLSLLLFAGPGIAQPAGGRYPQPVRVADLVGRQALRPVEAQDVLGRVTGVVRRPDGAVFMVLRLGGVLGFGSRTVAVPIEAMALLGEHVAVMDLSPEQLRGLPAYDGGAAAVPSAETIRMGLTRPFH